jgi:hypothetical protein
MVYYYGKVNEKVVDYLNLDRKSLYQYRDGGYLILMSAISRLAVKLNIQIGNGFVDMYRRTLLQVGGVLLTQQESKDEQDEKAEHPMPQAIDERFRIESNTDEDLLGEALGETEGEEDILTEEETEVSDEQSVSE